MEHQNVSQCLKLCKSRIYAYFELCLVESYHILELIRRHVPFQSVKPLPQGGLVLLGVPVVGQIRSVIPTKRTTFTSTATKVAASLFLVAPELRPANENVDSSPRDLENFDRWSVRQSSATFLRATCLPFREHTNTRKLHILNK